MSRELTDGDLNKCLPGTPITEYDDLDNNNMSLSQLMDKNGRGILFFQDGEENGVLSGHWVAILRNAGGLEVFDPYGGDSDPWHFASKFMSTEQLEETGQERPLLDNIAARSGMTINYTNDRLQRLNPVISTCGRHCVVRLWNSHMLEDEYEEYIRSMGNPDRVVSVLTYDVLGY